MSLRDDFEKEWSGFDLARDPIGGYFDNSVENFWQGYQAATERAVRIVQGLYPDFSLDGYAYIRAERAIKRIKGEV